MVDDRQLLGDIFRKCDVAWRAMRCGVAVTPAVRRADKTFAPGTDGQSLSGAGKHDHGRATRQAKNRAALIVSWSSLEKRSAEYEEIVKVKIPENTKEIAIARSYGDLSENFEFKAAKQMQSVLMRRKAELEQMLHDARGHFI